MFARQKLLKGLSSYLKDGGRPKASDLVASFEAMKAQGVPVEIKRIAPKT